MEAAPHSQRVCLQLERSLSAPEPAAMASLHLPPLVGAVPALATGAADGQAHPLLALLLQHQDRRQQGHPLALQQHLLQQQAALLAQQHAVAAHAAQQATRLPAQLLEQLPRGGAAVLSASTNPSAAATAATAAALAGSLPPAEQQPSGTFEEHWHRLDTAWQEARVADEEAWQQLRAAQVGAVQ